VSEIEEFLDQQLASEYGVCAEDGSIEQVSKLLLQNFLACASGNYTPVLQLIASYKPPPVDKSIKGIVPISQERHDNVEEAAAPSSSSSSTSAAAAAASSSSSSSSSSSHPTSDAPMADVSDEWTTVTSRGRRPRKK